MMPMVDSLEFSEMMCRSSTVVLGSRMGKSNEGVCVCRSGCLEV